MNRGCGRQIMLRQLFEGLLHVVDLKAEMVQARAMLLQPLLQRMIRLQRFHQLQLGITEVQMRQPYGSVIHNFAIQYPQADLIAPDPQSFVRVRNDDGQMVE